MKNSLVEIGNKNELDEFKKTNQSFLILFYSDSSKNSLAARTELEKLLSEKEGTALAAVNAKKIKDIHPLYNVSVVPTVISVKKGKETRRLEGKQNKGLYEALLYSTPVRRADGTEAPPLRVTVYSTTTCPHCTTVKNHLRKHRIRFTDVDVSRDTKAGEELMRRSGSGGVPQTDINGTLVVGADMAKINKLIGIR